MMDTSANDRNFDDLAHRFRRNVYDRLKGQLRLAVLRRDLAACVPALADLDGDRPEITPEPLRILDAGGGQGQLSVPLAKLGHRVTLCDISLGMLDLAREAAVREGVESAMVFHHGDIQSLCQAQAEHFDLVLCHAVLEWVAEPRQLLDHLIQAVTPGGWLSLSFYNVNSIVMKNLLRTNFRKVLAEDYRGYRGSLTPSNPLDPEMVYGWFADLGLEPLAHSGIRCFHDYLLDPAQRQSQPEAQLALELTLSRREPFRSLARYIHLVVGKSD